MLQLSTRQAYSCTYNLSRSLRSLHTSKCLLSGHNKWSKIRHKKGAADQQRGQMFSKLGNDITLAAKLGGSTDPSFNVRLAASLLAAKKADMPKSNIEAALKRAAPSKAGEEALQHVTYEAMHGQVAMMIEALTDKKTRTGANIKAILRKHAATLGSCQFLFDKRGRVVVRPAEGEPSMSYDDALDLSIEVDAEDVIDLEDGSFELITAPSDLGSIAKKLNDRPVEILAAELCFRPKEDTAVDIEGNEEVLELIERLEDDADVVNVTVNSL
ncbi:transcriptional regulator TACO1-like protein [Protomyces lactucae-debilis]|uniref:Transcriptional regulator TACO1-like protein n=1 Tax=Protomyces lactucae-debilis TaxID=2754530 RepID=A0A1Y2FNF3_PROLT|nr:transcriptional regulator TACO1-like protein [Protomyces lactucae-debilis]ORY85521.1 transcriptional regulator TACO1-like protein [Protomyces lactucae-debilis]